MVVDRATGLLVPPGDVAALAAAITSILSDQETARAYGIAGRDRAREFSVSAVADRLEEMYADAIATTKAEVSHVG